MKDYNNIALKYSEKYGIIDYEVKNNKMIYYVNYLLENRKYECIVNLDTLKETRKIIETIQ